MIDKFDYAEPACPLCDGADFYYPKKDAPRGRIPTTRIIEKIDSLFDKNDYKEAGRLLRYWQNEAAELGDAQGELSMLSELIGYYRKQNDKENALASVGRTLTLIDELGQGELASGATMLINCATAYKAFGLAREAMPLYLRAEEIYKRTLSEGDERFGGLYNNMALALCELARYEEAERAYFSAISIMEKIPSGEAECAISYINLAHLYCDSGRTSLVEGALARAYELLMGEELVHNGYYAFVLEKCAPSFKYFGHDEIYLELKRESERIYERS